MLNWANQQADEDFHQARSRALWNTVYRWLRGYPTSLLPLEEVRRHVELRGQRDLGMQVVPLDKIVGSEGRAGQFDRLFLPRSRKVGDRWKRIARARHENLSLPPVDLIKVGDIYFVRDGNHRLSVARHVGQQEIRAHVTELEPNVPLTTSLDEDDLDRKAAQSAFVKDLRLPELLPDLAIPIEASDEATYQELMKHIDQHQKALSARQGKVEHDEAVRHYFETVYLPQIAAMRRLHTAVAFPRRTETNLYLSIMRERRRIAAKEGRDPGPDAAVTSFMSRFGTWNRRGRFRHRTGLRDLLLTWLQYLLDAFSRLFQRKS